MEKWYSKIEKYIDQNKDEIIENLKALVKIPSISKAGAPIALYSSATTCALEQGMSGEKVVGVVPLVTSFSTAQMTGL